MKKKPLVSSTAIITELFNTASLKVDHYTKKLNEAVAETNHYREALAELRS